MARRGVRGILASMFVIGTVAAGIGVSASGAGAGANGGGGEENCKIPFNPVPVELSTQVAPPMEKPSHCTTIEVTKVVTGTPTAAPPPGTEFHVVVDCVKHENSEADGLPSNSSASSDSIETDSLPQGNKPPFETTLTFGPEGGTQQVLVADKHDSDCTITEEPPAGCTLTSIDPETIEVRGEPPRVATDSQTTENGNGKETVIPVTVTNNCDPEAVQPEAAAAAVVATPRFTG